IVMGYTSRTGLPPDPAVLDRFFGSLEILPLSPSVEPPALAEALPPGQGVTAPGSGRDPFAGLQAVPSFSPPEVPQLPHVRREFPGMPAMPGGMAQPPAIARPTFQPPAIPQHTFQPPALPTIPSFHPLQPPQ